jgi:putative heme iron utilization protein
VKRRCGCTAHDEQVLTKDRKVNIEIFSTLLDTDLISIKKERFDKLYKNMEIWGLCIIFAKHRKIRAG